MSGSRARGGEDVPLLYNPGHVPTGAWPKCELGEGDRPCYRFVPRLDADWIRNRRARCPGGASAGDRPRNGDRPSMAGLQGGSGRRAVTKCAPRSSSRSQDLKPILCPTLDRPTAHCEISRPYVENLAIQSIEGAGGGFHLPDSLHWGSPQSLANGGPRCRISQWPPYHPNRSPYLA